MFDGIELEGLGILDFYIELKINWLIGDIVIESDIFGIIVGFENYGGRIYYDFGIFGYVIFGYGNNDEDKKEGIYYKNLLGIYLYGLILFKNYEIIDYLLEKVCECKGILFEFKEIDNEVEI